MALAYPRTYSPGVGRALAGGDPVEFDTDRAVSRLRVPGADLLVLHQRPPDTDAIVEEADRLLWLDGRGPSPRVSATGRAAEGDETVIVVIPAESSPLSSGLGLASAEAVAVEMGRALRQLHELPIGDCPFDAASSTLVDQLRWRLQAGDLQPASWGPYRRREPDDLVGIVEKLIADLPTNPTVYVHAALTAKRMWMGPDGVINFTGWARSGLGDRHLDLAGAAAVLSETFGAAAVTPMVDAYGFDAVDLRRLDAHQLLVHLLL